MIELSVIVPNRNSQFTTQTINDLLNKAGCEVEVIVNVDENWPTPLVDDPRVTYIHPSAPIGLRQGINACMKLALGKYMMKIDDHCSVGENYGRILIDSHEQDNWVQIPRRYALDAEKWEIGNLDDPKYPIDYMYLDFPTKGKDHDDGMHGVPWKRHERADVMVDDTPTMQGSCYFMTKNHFDNFLGGLQEMGYGQFSQEAQEISFKTWLGGGAVKVNKKTWYAHLHKGKTYGRMYQMPGGTAEGSNWSADYWLNNKWEGRIHDFSWLINTKFPDMPKWEFNWQEEIERMGWIN